MNKITVCPYFQQYTDCHMQFILDLLSSSLAYSMYPRINITSLKDFIIHLNEYKFDAKRFVFEIASSLVVFTGNRTILIQGICVMGVYGYIRKKLRIQLSDYFKTLFVRS